MNTLREKIRVAVIGGSRCSKEVGELAYEVGRQIARRGAILVCGGLGGAMEETCRGARDESGLTIGILPGSDRNEANPYVDIPIPTGMGIARNVLVVRSASVVIALPGKYGTLSEIALALNLGIPVIGLTTGVSPADEIIPARDARDAVAKAEEYARGIKK